MQSDKNIISFNNLKEEIAFFYNPFPLWFIIFVVMPFQIIAKVTYLPYYIFHLLGLGRFYKFGHYIMFENIEQFTLQPKNYCKHTKEIHLKIVKDAKEEILYRSPTKLQS